MKARLALLLVVALMTAFAVGCGDEPGTQEVSYAGAIDDGAEKYAPSQYSCPVCGGRPIYGDYYVEVDGKRVYFDKEECAEKFDENRQKYLEELKKRTLGGPPSAKKQRK